MKFRQTHLSVLSPAVCDYLGHVNASAYIEATGQAVMVMQNELGISPADLRDGRRISFALSEEESRYHAELSSGDIISIETALVEVGDKTITFLHRLVRVEDNLLAFECRAKCVLMDLVRRKAIRIPDDIRATAMHFLGDSAAGD